MTPSETSNQSGNNDLLIYGGIIGGAVVGGSVALLLAPVAVPTILAGVGAIGLGSLVASGSASTIATIGFFATSALAGGTIFGVAGAFISDICCNQQDAKNGDDAKTDLTLTEDRARNSEAENTQLSNPSSPPSSRSHSSPLPLLPPPPKSSLYRTNSEQPAQTNEIALAGGTSENAVAGPSVGQPLQESASLALPQQSQEDVMGASSIAGSSQNQNQANSPPPARVARMRSSPSLQTILEEDEEHLPKLSQDSLPQTKNLSLSQLYMSEMTAPSEDLASSPTQLAHTTRAGVGGGGEAGARAEAGGEAGARAEAGGVGARAEAGGVGAVARVGTEVGAGVGARVGVSGGGGARVGDEDGAGVGATLVFAYNHEGIISPPPPPQERGILQPQLENALLPEAVANQEEAEPPLRVNELSLVEAQLGFVTSSPPPQTPLRPHQPLPEEAMSTPPPPSFPTYRGAVASAILAFSPPPPHQIEEYNSFEARVLGAEIVFTSPARGEVTDAPPPPPQPPHNIITTPLRPPLPPQEEAMSQSASADLAFSPPPDRRGPEYYTHHSATTDPTNVAIIVRLDADKLRLAQGLEKVSEEINPKDARAIELVLAEDASRATRDVWKKREGGADPDFIDPNYKKEDAEARRAKGEGMVRRLVADLERAPPPH